MRVAFVVQRYGEEVAGPGPEGAQELVGVGRRRRVGRGRAQ